MEVGTCVGSPQRGFTIVELGIAVSIIAVLVAIGFPLFLRQANQAKDSEAQQILRNALVIEELHHLDTGVYTQNRRDLARYENSIVWNANGDPAGSVRVRVRAAFAETEVCLFSYSASGVLHAVYHTATQTRFGRPDQIRACNPNNARTWSTEGW